VRARGGRASGGGGDSDGVGSGAANVVGAAIADGDEDEESEDVCAHGRQRRRSGPNANGRLMSIARAQRQGVQKRGSRRTCARCLCTLRIYCETRCVRTWHRSGDDSALVCSVGRWKAVAGRGEARLAAHHRGL
jgi:hypothetical protein